MQVARDVFVAPEAELEVQEISPSCRGRRGSRDVCEARPCREGCAASAISGNVGRRMERTRFFRLKPEYSSRNRDVRHPPSCTLMDQRSS